MPSCSIKQCSARRSKNQPLLTVHRFPKSVILRRKWLEAIGPENINARHKEPYICSLHFEESQFNRTLDVVRLHDDAVPTLFLLPPGNINEQVVTGMNRPKDIVSPDFDTPFASKDVSILCGISNTQEKLVSITSPPSESQCHPHEMPSTSKHVPVFCETVTMHVDHPKENLPLAYEKPSTSKHVPVLSEICNMQVDQPKENLLPACEKIGRQSNKLQKLQKICDEQRKKIKRLNEKLRRQGKKISSLQEIIGDLKQKLIINTEQSTLLEDCSGSQDFLKRQLAKNKGLPLEKKYSEEIRKFALTLHFLSPKAYDFIRAVYNTCLPHPRTLSKWYQHVNADAGFTAESFETLRKKVQQSKSHKILCALSFDEISIRKGLTWDPKGQKYYGRVDYGHNIDCDQFDVANQCLVFLLTCINGTWKLPIGYFLITHVTGEQKSLLVETAIKLTEDTGCQVVSVTCDGPAANFSMFTDLGCRITKNQEQPSFETSNKNVVHAFIDPCHAIKLVRNTLGDLRILIDGMGRIIDFKYLELLLKLQEEQGLHLGTKLSKAHIFFDKQKMKVRLATQLLSNSVADALLFCKTELQLVEFEDCEGTVNFINLINNVFDVLNSHSIRPPGLKKAMCPNNIGFVRALFEGAIDYIRALRLPSGE